MTNNNNNRKVLDFLSFFIAELKINHVNTFDVTKFINVVVNLKNTPEFADILNDFSANLETCHNQMMEICNTLNEWEYIDKKTKYELHFLSQNLDSKLNDLPKTIDHNSFHQFLNFMKTLQEKSNQDVISESELWQIISRLQKERNYSEEEIEKQRKEIQQYLSILNHLGYLTMMKTYMVSIPDHQREEYRKITNQVNFFLKYYNNPQMLDSTKQVESTRTNKEIPLVKEVTPSFQDIPDLSEKVSSVIEPSPDYTMPITGNEPVDYIPISSRPVAPHSHFKSVRGVLLSFLALLQNKGIYQFDSVSFEEAMNEIIKSPSYYEFPSNFGEFAEQYIGVPLKRKGKENNLYKKLDSLAIKRQIKREGNFC